ncbi:MAG: hypothetical protein L0287_34930 [Anaerolineae bacterium]|nr:hypothetical protein [Anaerolineae bacterium]MCI0609337.1 hypothetical protein [Anaerolineae bacterium]
MSWSTLADYFTIAFFFWYGLRHFVPALKSDMSMLVGAVLALVTAITTLLNL